MPEFVYTMQDLRKVVPPDRIILDDITLAFLPGAKIGVLELRSSRGTGACFAVVLPLHD